MEENNPKEKFFSTNFRDKFELKDFEELLNLLKKKGIKVDFNILNLINRDLLTIPVESIQAFKECFKSFKGIHLIEHETIHSSDSFDSFRITYEDGWNGGQFLIEKNGALLPYTLGDEVVSVEVQGKDMPVYPHRVFGEDCDHGRTHQYVFHTAVMRSGMLLHEFLKLANEIKTPVILKVRKTT